MPLLASRNGTVTWTLVSVALGSLGGVSGLVAIILALRHHSQINATKDRLTELSGDLQRYVHSLSDQGTEHLEETRKVREQMLDALDIHQELLADADLEERIKAMAAAFNVTLESTDPLFLRFARQTLEQAQERIGMSAQRTLRVTENPYEAAEYYASEILKASGSGDEFWACSLVDPEFWDRAALYLQAHKQKSGIVTMNRLFIFQSEEAHQDERSLHHMNQQCAWRVNVRFLIVPGVLTGPLADDWDMVLLRKVAADQNLTNRYAARFRINPNRTIDHIDIYSADAKEVEVERIEARIEQLWHRGSVHGWAHRSTEECDGSQAEHEQEGV